ncbi:hypothetical protein MMC07_001119 [Pseudocyphellaria aurata]|nr:hypothetical protein [Pseudocyphellaria aurata]
MAIAYIRTLKSLRVIPKHETVLWDPLGKKFWDIPSPICASGSCQRLRGRLETMGSWRRAGSKAHDEEVDRDDESDQITLTAVNDAVRFSTGKKHGSFHERAR